MEDEKPKKKVIGRLRRKTLRIEKSILKMKIKADAYRLLLVDENKKNYDENVIDNDGHL